MPPKPLTKSRKDSTTAVAKERRKLWLQCLIGLEFPLRAFEVRYKITINDAMFDKPNKTGFEVICYFLFSTLNAEKAKELFRTCYPVYTKKQWQDFRTVCSNWWKRIAEENPLFNIPRVSATLLMAPGGPECYKLLSTFASFVMHTEAQRLSGKDEATLLPPVPSKSKAIVPAQVVALKSACHSESLGMIHTMQLSKHSDEEAVQLAGEMLERHRELKKRKKDQEACKTELIAQSKINIKRTPRTSVAKTPEKALRARTTRDLNAVRTMWNKIQITNEDMAEERKVVKSILMRGDGDRTLDAARLAPKVPAALLQQCADKIHESVGTSLYQAGELNLTSLVKLFNLSLHLVLEKLHEVGAPNFESQLPFIVAQNNIHAKNNDTLERIRQQLGQMAPEMKRKTRRLKDRVDRHYQEQTEAENTLISGLPKPDLESSAVLAPNDQNDLVTGLFSLSPPFQFSDNAEAATPVLPGSLDLPEDILGCVYGIKPPLLTEPPERDVECTSELPATCTPDCYRLSNSAEARSVTWSQPSITPTVVKQGTLEFTPVIRKGELGKEMLRKRMAEKTLDASQKDFLTMSLSDDDAFEATSGPCSPLLKTPGDTVIEKVQSRTPEAVRKLVDQVVDYTMQEMSVLPGNKPSGATPADVASPVFFDLSSQLDATVFQSRDKIARTPPGSELLGKPLSISESETKENMDPDSINSPDSSTAIHSTGSSSPRTKESLLSGDDEDLTSEGQVSHPAFFTTFQNLRSYTPLPSNVFATPLTPTNADTKLPHSPAHTPAMRPPFTPGFRDMDFSNCPNLFDVAPPDFLDSFTSPDTPNAPVVPVGNLIDL